MSSRHILTAAHCFSREDPEGYTVYVGSTTRDQGTKYNVSEVKFHESFRAGTEKYNANDILVLTLSQDVEFDENAAAACLPTKSIKEYEGEGVTVSGWGRTTEGGSVTTDLQVLKEVEILSWCLDE